MLLKDRNHIPATIRRDPLSSLPGRPLVLIRAAGLRTRCTAHPHTLHPVAITSGLHAYTRACGWSLARAHARSGDRLAIAAYLGAGPTFDRAVAHFSAAYADQNELDHQRLADTVAVGEIPAVHGI